MDSYVQILLASISCICTCLCEFVVRREMETVCNIFILKTENVADLEKGLLIVFTTSQQVFQDCMRSVMSIAGALEAAVNGSVMQGVLLHIQTQTKESVMVDVRVSWYQTTSLVE